jgi:hypothetical protein
VVTFSEAVTATDATGFSISGSVGATSITNVSGSGTATLTFTLNGTAANGETITLSYDDTSGNVADVAGNDLASFSNHAVTNNVGVKTVTTIAAQSGSLTYGTGASVTFAVTTGGITGSVAVSLTWFSDTGGTSATTGPAGVTADTPVTAGASPTNITVTTTNSSPAGTYYFRAIIDSVTSTGVGTVTINKATPGYTAPTGLTAIVGQTLNAVSLAGFTGFSWDTDENAVTTPVGSAGSNTFKVKFTPTDTTNYNVVNNISVSIAVANPTGTGRVVIQYWVSDVNDATLATNTGAATLSRGAGETALITAATTGYTNHQWTLNGIDVPGAEGTASSYTFDSAGKGNGNYIIGLQVQKGTGGASAPWYSTPITITVTN